MKLCYSRSSVTFTGVNCQAVINEEASGDVKGLQEQIQQLKVGTFLFNFQQVVIVKFNALCLKFLPALIH